MTTVDSVFKQNISENTSLVRILTTMLLSFFRTGMLNSSYYSKLSIYVENEFCQNLGNCFLIFSLLVSGVFGIKQLLY